MGIHDELILVSGKLIGHFEDGALLLFGVDLLEVSDEPLVDGIQPKMIK